MAVRRMESEVVAVLDGCVGGGGSRHASISLGASSDAYFADGTFGNGWVDLVDASTIWRGR